MSKPFSKLVTFLCSFSLYYNQYYATCFIREQGEERGSNKTLSSFRQPRSGLFIGSKLSLVNCSPQSEGSGSQRNLLSHNFIPHNSHTFSVFWVQNSPFLSLALFPPAGKHHLDLKVILILALKLKLTRSSKMPRTNNDSTQENKILGSTPKIYYLGGQSQEYMVFSSPKTLC